MTVTMLLIVIIIVLLLVIVGGGVFFVVMQKRKRRAMAAEKSAIVKEPDLAEADISLTDRGRQVQILNDEAEEEGVSAQVKPLYSEVNTVGVMNFVNGENKRPKSEPQPESEGTVLLGHAMRRPAVSRPADPPEPHVTLTYDEGGQKKTVRLRTQPITIGRGSANDIVIISDRFVSMNHAALHLENGALIIQDLNATNGTFYNGKRIEGAIRVRDSCEIKLANTPFVITFM